MDRLMAFVSMGGHGEYIWPCYLIAVVILGGLLFASLRSVREQEARLSALRKARRRLPEEDA